MRRSNSMTSISHIPLRLQFGNSGDRKSRAQSISRVTQQGPRNSSLDKKSSLTKLTPLNRPRGRDRLTTPSDIGSVGSSRSRVSPASGLKDRKTIQKLSTNKNWVANQYAKVRCYIVNSTIFDTQVVNADNIKPPTIKAFIYLVTVLLQQLFDSVKITQENYKDVVIKKLKVLHYPGVMTLSTLKSVNTMHAWPQVIGMLGWLIDKIEIENNGTIDYSVVREEEKHKYLLTELCSRFVTERYKAFNQPDQISNEIADELEQRFTADFTEILGYSDNDFDTIKEEYYKNNEIKNSLKNDIESLAQENESLKTKKCLLRDELSSLEAADDDEESGLCAELDFHNKTSLKLVQREAELRSNITKLEEVVKSQKFSYSEKKALLKELNMLKNEVNKIKEKIEYAQTIKNEFDARLVEEREKLESKVLNWNRSLMVVCIQKPHLKQLLLKETKLHMKEFLEEIREVYRLKIEIEKKITEEIELMSVNKKKLTEEIYIAKNDLKSTETEIDQMMSEIQEFSENRVALEEDTKQILSYWEIKKKNFLLELQNSSEEEQKKSLTQKNEAMKERKKQLQIEIEKFGEEAVAFMMDYNKQIDEGIKEMNSILINRKKQIEEAVMKELEDRNRLIVFLEEFN